MLLFDATAIAQHKYFYVLSSQRILKRCTFKIRDLKDSRNGGVMTPRIFSSINTMRKLEKKCQNEVFRNYRNYQNTYTNLGSIYLRKIAQFQ